MVYSYEFDGRRVGDFEWRIPVYEEIHKGLVALHRAVVSWNTEVRKLSGQSPYEREQQRLRGLIDHGSKELRDGKPYVYLSGLSVGSLRLLRAGLEFQEQSLNAEIRSKKAEGWPSGALNALSLRVNELRELASTIDFEPADILWEILPTQESSTVSTQVRETLEAEAALWDFFICHASEDKDEFVRPLYEALTEKGCKVWFDEYALRWGDSLRRSIDKGLSRARYGIVVLSPSFFAKEWPQRELDGLVAREEGGRKVILPVWHKMDGREVAQHSPLLADRVAVKSTDLTVIVDILVREFMEPTNC